MMTLIEGIAERITAMRYGDLPPEAVHWAKVAIVDTVEVTLAGTPEPCAPSSLPSRSANWTLA